MHIHNQIRKKRSMTSFNIIHNITQRIYNLSLVAFTFFATDEGLLWL